MTITLQAVNELIASLESAGELSIREQKFLKLAKAFKQLAAENAALKSYRDTLDEIKSGLVGGGHGHMAKADMQAQSALLDVIFDAFDDIETPATDRIVAEAEAEARGVEKFADEQRGVAERLKKRGGDVVTSSIKFCLNSAEEAEDFAKQLREGADK